MTERFLCPCHHLPVWRMPPHYTILYCQVTGEIVDPAECTDTLVEGC